MKKNVGLIDKITRIIIAAVILVLFLTDVITGVAGIVLLVIGGVLVLASITGRCGLYSPLGINTCKVKNQEKQEA